jgi:hypothetical protein
MPMTFDRNLADLKQHQREFVAGEAFAYSVLDEDDVIDFRRTRASTTLV